jgi:hypothetical protein
MRLQNKPIDLFCVAQFRALRQTVLTAFAIATFACDTRAACKIILSHFPQLSQLPLLLRPHGCYRRRYCS